MKATLCKHKHGYGNKYSLVPTGLISGGRQLWQADDGGKMSLIKSGEMSMNQETILSSLPQVLANSWMNSMEVV